MVAGRLKLSAIPLFIIAGVLLGPGTPGPTIVEHSEGVGILSELGIVLLLFFLGLEFSLDRLTQARRLVMVGGLVDLAICFGTGFGLGIMFFGVGAEAFLLAGLLAETGPARRLYLIWMLLFWLAFAWYLPIAAGERFLMPLLLPTLGFVGLGIVRVGQLLKQRKTV